MKTIPVSACLACALLPLAAWSQPSSPSDQRMSGDDHKRRFAETWKTADTNGDGSLNPEEFASLPRLQSVPEDQQQRIFERLDKNSNKLIEREEMQRHRPPDREGENPMRRLWELDTDNSGGISGEEFNRGEFIQKLPAERRLRLFERLDTNKDGTITPEDKPKRPDHPERRPNPEGRPFRQRPQEPGKPEGAPRPDVLRPSMLPRLDLNKDGVLDFAEFSKIPFFSHLDEDQLEKKFQGLDHNKDLKLTSDEFGPAKHSDGRHGQPMRPDNQVKPLPVE